MPASTSDIRLRFVATAAWRRFNAMPSKADCVAQSGDRTAALVELYTSEGCASCPPAERRLGGLAQELDAVAQRVPLVLLVSYWDQPGRQDGFAQPAERQKWPLAGHDKAIVYTPQFFIAGREPRDCQAGLSAPVPEVNETQGGGHIRRKARPQGDTAMVLQVEARAALDTTSAVLYLALNESGLRPSVSSGKTRGRTLAEEQGAGPARREGADRVGRQFNRKLTLGADWTKARLGRVVFMRNARDGPSVQALGSGPADDG